MKSAAIFSVDVELHPAAAIGEIELRRQLHAVVVARHRVVLGADRLLHVVQARACRAPPEARRLPVRPRARRRAPPLSQFAATDRQRFVHGRHDRTRPRIAKAYIAGPCLTPSRSASLPPTGDRNRLTTAFRLILALPHMILVGSAGARVGVIATRSSLGGVAGFLGASSTGARSAGSRSSERSTWRASASSRSSSCGGTRGSLAYAMLLVDRAIRRSATPTIR